MVIRVRRGVEANRLSYTPQIAELISTTDEGKLYVGDGSTPGGVPVDSGVETVIAGTNVIIDNSDPKNPVISSTSGGGGAVDSVNGQIGVVVLDTDDVAEGTNKYVTSAEKTILSNTSGVNTGDQDISGKADTSALTAHTINTLNPHSVTKTQVGLGNVQNTDLTATVASNSSARHSHANKSLLDTYTQTEVNLADAVSKKHDPVDISGKQDTLVSATNIRTINGISVLGSGDIPISGGGGGDMLKATYDPNTVNADAFSQDNMADGSTNKNYTSTDKSRLATITDANYKNSNTTKAQVGLSNVPNTDFTSAVAANTAKVSFDATSSSRLADTSGTNTGDQTTITGNAGSATVLQTSRTVRTDLASTSTASFNGSANITPGVTGTLPVANGGTGSTTHTSGNYLKGAGTGAVTSETPASLAANIGNLLFPVGSYYMNETNSTNPGTLLGFGTWVAVADKMIVGKGSGTFATAGATGGAETATIAQANLPNISTGAGTAHTHVQDSHNHTQNSHLHTVSGVRGGIAWSGGASRALDPDVGGTQNTSSATPTNNATTATNQNESAHTHSLGGSGTALGIMNPYVVAYIWKRTA